MVRHNIKVMATITALSIFVFFAFRIDPQIGVAVLISVFGLYAVARGARGMANEVIRERAEQNERDKKAHDKFVRANRAYHAEERRLKFTGNLGND